MDLALPSLFLPLEWLPSSNAQKSSALLEIQAVCPPDERSWILGEEIIAGTYLNLVIRNSD